MNSIEDHEKMVKLFDYMKELKIKPQKAFGIVHFLQEHLELVSPNSELCNSCKELYDSNSEGYYCETKGEAKEMKLKASAAGKFLCNDCGYRYFRK